MEAALSLYELNKMVRGLIENGCRQLYWVRGELAEGRQAQNGHFYGELVDRDASGKTIVARARVNCWAGTYRLVSLSFLKQTGKQLGAGLKVLLQVSVTFHEQYGYSLNIHDIDPSFTLGDAEARRRQIIEQLRADGLLEANRQLGLPRLTQRIAIVSSETAAGYGDFVNQLQGNAQGFAFACGLFPAVMQGQGVTDSIIAALSKVAANSGQWDVAVIIRGGGATTDLSDFDSYPLAAFIAQFPLPVITGIGHERDTTVLDCVAHTSLKTPTAVAAFLVDHAQRQAELLASLRQRLALAAQRDVLNGMRWLDQQQRRLALAAQSRLTAQRRRLDDFRLRLPLTAQSLTARQRNALGNTEARLRAALRLRLEKEKHKLSLLNARMEGLDPVRQLQRGYSITLLNGRALRSADGLQPGQQIVTVLSKGQLTSEIKTWKSS
ncbi:MAG: exodeoxyribonuclease VII large subunit [Prevotellaceae bacterium]|nr:exodeoxyribonuclease VII large subunit [Prevotellaceae bacterium]